MDILPQVLRKWYWTLPLKYSVNDFMQEIKKWYIEGHLDEGVWDHLRTVVSPDIVPTGVVRKQTYTSSCGGIASTPAPSGAVPSTDGRSKLLLYVIRSLAITF